MSLSAGILSPGPPRPERPSVPHPEPASPPSFQCGPAARAGPRGTAGPAAGKTAAAGTAMSGTTVAGTAMGGATMAGTERRSTARTGCFFPDTSRGYASPSAQAEGFCRASRSPGRERQYHPPVPLPLPEPGAGLIFSAFPLQEPRIRTNLCNCPCCLYRFLCVPLSTGTSSWPHHED